ncbi:E3 ubiquitin ligase TRIM40 [Monodelphis domestica]|uniref:Tripartite motif containing 40 n=1 Tax=Monodelphis domestica TaxID=13616 RepID=F6UQ46_MONDO|nr:E3 ubiquitin ligase TRIM40 [Monodelphis domestica]
MNPQPESSPEKGLCPICQELLREPVSTDCGHFFCQACLIQHAKKALEEDVFYCPVCRKLCSQSILGAGYYCEVHQKKVGWFCEEKQVFLCPDCYKSPEHQDHYDQPIDKAIIHYKERIHRRIRKLRKIPVESWHLPKKKEKLQTLWKQIDSEKQKLKDVLEKQQMGEQGDTDPELLLDNLNSFSEEVTVLQHKISEEETKLNDLIANMEEASKQLNITTLKSVNDLLRRNVKEKLYYLEVNSSELEKKIRKLIQPAPLIQVPCLCQNTPSES